jgi:hypothetical protein
MLAPRIRLECLKLAVEMCKTASAFDRPDRVLELAKQFEDYCSGEPSAAELGAGARALGIVDPGRQMPGDPPPDPPEKPRSKKQDMAKFLR